MTPELLKRAQDLRRLAERAGTEEEAKTAARVLSRFMSKHRLADVNLDLGASAADLAFEGEAIHEAGRVSYWRHNLAVGLGKLYGVVVVRERAAIRVPRRRAMAWKKRYRLRLCGEAADCDRVRRLFCWLSDDVMRLGREWARSHAGGAVSSWRLGFVDGLLRSARDGAAEARAEAQGNEAQSAALVVIDGRWERSLAFLQDWADVDTSQAKAKKITSVDAAAYVGGYDQGRQRHPSERIDG